MQGLDSQRDGAAAGIGTFVAEVTDPDGVDGGSRVHRPQIDAILRPHTHGEQTQGQRSAWGHISRIAAFRAPESGLCSLKLVGCVSHSTCYWSALLSRKRPPT